MNSLPKTVTRQRRGCDLNPGPSAPESSTLTTRLRGTLTGEVDKSANYSCQIFQDLTYRKLLKSVNFWQSYSKNKKVDVFWDTW